MATIHTILHFRSSIQPSIGTGALDKEYIRDILKSKSYNEKWVGECAGPWEKFFCFVNIDGRGISRESDRCNSCHVRIYEATSTMSKRVQHYKMDIIIIENRLYVVAIAQSSSFRKTTGVDSIVYECKDYSDLKSVVDVIIPDIA